MLHDEAEMSWDEVGKRIAELRQDNDLTQTQFAKLIGISRDKLSRIERGLKSSGDLIPIICKKIGVSADYIYFGKADPWADIAFFRSFDPADLEILFDLLKRCMGALCTTNVNELLINEIMLRQGATVKG